MNSSLIFTEQRLFPRLIDFLMSLCGWCGFIGLMTEGVLEIVQRSPWVESRVMPIELNTFSLYFAIGIFNALLLIGWAKYNQYRFRIERRTRDDGLNSEEVAQSFAIQTNHIHTLNRNHIQRVWHDEWGSVVRIESMSVNHES
ncbi:MULTISPECIES: poly-beta-1,6-N-acetyl-D-glucosamine biosynthesis protein PgaD [unclassified Brenneria]|uniref:poly-beta-1,6-N-acetyl-D-glucosamine biosynthesis protein PgaD n=1 Tax=unclassified Brenneria TaxID=2634434 RepID=UPI0018F0B7BF|nr:poly-beta-1,6-N-acetyl-D-glucosamine biosynthesis protein PgaD [Brenneria sp. L3-3C-1]MBJ7221295.1 poly-beta-1,6-N-acetyl-D-glucosamine biosynthesis protein PgaD [Brenneria sp. L3-3C-1]MEE3642539.1 poly-beta-1,6-N-acetyl-D-glucosamine biosynthesis protein PgaD [Brenneria sp. L3_3C_1]